jgi:MoaA/NifB/PqqE/SkfB family radical SAM enzyme
MFYSLIKAALQSRVSRAINSFSGNAGKRYYDEKELVSRLSLRAESLQRDYIETPFVVSIETLALCNAACSFCPYDTMERKGTEMSMELIKKIINDLKDIPADKPFLVLPYKVNEPFLDSRIFSIARLILDELPNAELGFITNGSAFTQEKIDNLLALERVCYLTISLNFNNVHDYENVMKISFHNTINKMDLLHQTVDSLSKRTFPIRVTKVSESLEKDTDFIAFVKSRYPLFSPNIVPRNDWLGNVETAERDSRVPDAPCHRWFDFSISATGKVAMCCMDGNIEYPKGNVTTDHVLDIYNQTRLIDFRQRLPSRKDVALPCKNCTYLSY